MIKIQICFVMIKKKMVFNDKKIRSVFYMFFKKNEKDFLRREFHS